MSGTVSARIGSLTIETATPVALVGLALLFLALHLLLRLGSAILRLPGITGRWRAERRRHQGDEAVTRALLALAAGAQADARREAARAQALLGESPQTLLLVAEAGRLSGREDEAEQAFRALSLRPDAAFLGFRGLLRQAITREDWTAAAALARQADAAHPGAKWVRQERAHLAVRAGNWTEALALAESDTARAALATAAARAEPDEARARRLARQAWKQDPSLSPATLTHAEQLRRAGHEGRVTAVLHEAWTAAPHPDLAAFLLHPIEDRLARAQAAQKLVAGNPDHPESHVLLARTALDAGLTGEARHHLERLRTAGVNQRRVWLLRAEVEEKERGETEAGRQAQRDALRRAAEADPDPGWRCFSCNTPQPHWSPACPSCLTAGGVRWGAGPAIVTLPGAARQPAG
jgi:HemY protein